jgi:chorismate mutase / prephenate dehydratase
MTQRSPEQPPSQKGSEHAELERTADSADLDSLREQIDALDDQLLRLLNQRAALVVEVGKLKRGSGIPIYAPHREAAILDRVMRMNTGPLSERTIEAIYRELMSGSFHLEQPLRIGYLGPEGSYSHIAAMEHFGSSVEFDNLRAIEGVFVEVARGHVDYGLVPIENSTGGGVSETMDAFTRYHHLLNVYAEVQLSVSRCLLANCLPQEVMRIHASADGYAQCRTWLATQYPQAVIVPQPSSSDAIRVAKDELFHGQQPGVAAIGSALAGEIHGLHVLFEHIEDHPNEITRFLILSRQRSKPSGDDKTSIMFTTPDRPGALVDVLSVFHQAEINLTHIDKRPSGRVNWEYTFFIDAVGHRDDPRFQKAIDESRTHCKDLTVIGSYPRSRRVL